MCAGGPQFDAGLSQDLNEEIAKTDPCSVRYSTCSRYVLIGIQVAPDVMTLVFERE